MSSYRRVRLEGASYFFTVALADRRSCVLVEEIELLRAAVRTTLQARPVRIDAMVILPDHLYCVWTLPLGDSDYSTRWREFKTRFTTSVGGEWRRSPSKIAKGEKGLWQRRFWEHTIRDERDMAAHIEYCWINPVKHGLVRRVVDWPYASFHRDVRRGIIPADWAGEMSEAQFGEPA